MKKGLHTFRTVTGFWFFDFDQKLNLGLIVQSEEFSKMRGIELVGAIFQGDEYLRIVARKLVSVCTSQWMFLGSVWGQRV